VKATLWMANHPAWCIAELAAVQYQQAQARFGDALLAGDIALAHVELVEVFQLAEQIEDDLTSWGCARAASPWWMPGWESN